MDTEVVDRFGNRFSVVDSALTVTYFLVTTRRWSVYPVQSVQLVDGRPVITCIVDQAPAYFQWDVNTRCACRIAGPAASIAIGPYTEIKNGPYLETVLRGHNVADLRLLGNNVCIESLDGARCIRTTQQDGTTVYYNWHVENCVFLTPPEWHEHQVRPVPIQNGAYYVSVENNDPFNISLVNAGNPHGVSAVVLHPEFGTKPVREWDRNELQASVHPPEEHADPHSLVTLYTERAYIYATFEERLYTVMGQFVECFNTRTRKSIATYDVEDEQFAGNDMASIDVKFIVASRTHLVVFRAHTVCIHSLPGGQFVRKLTCRKPLDPTQLHATIRHNKVAWISGSTLCCYDIDSDTVHRIKGQASVVAMRIHNNDTVVVVSALETRYICLSDGTIRSVPTPNHRPQDVSRYELSCDGSRLAYLETDYNDDDTVNCVLSVFSYTSGKTLTLFTGTGIRHFQFVPTRPSLLLVHVQGAIMLLDADTGSRYMIWSTPSHGSVVAVTPTSVTMDIDAVMTSRFPDMSQASLFCLIAASRRRIAGRPVLYLPDELYMLLLHEFMEPQD